MNKILKKSILNQRAKFHKHMTTLTRKIKDQTDELHKIKNLYFNLIIQQDRYKELNEQTAQKILILTDLTRLLYLSSKHNKIKEPVFLKKQKASYPDKFFKNFFL